MNQPTEPKADKSGVRRHNLSLVLRTVHEAGETTRAAVAARVGLTRPAVSSLVEQLLDLGFLVESGKTFSGQAGRPGTVLKPADTGAAGLGVEINIDYVTVCVVDLTGTDRVRRTERLDNRAADAAEVLDRAARIAAESLDAAAGRGWHRPERGSPSPDSSATARSGRPPISAGTRSPPNASSERPSPRGAPVPADRPALP